MIFLLILLPSIYIYINYIWIGPLAVAVDATNWSDYEGGIFDGCNYNESISLNHAVQVNISFYLDFSMAKLNRLKDDNKRKELITIFSSSVMELVQHMEIIG